MGIYFLWGKTIDTTAKEMKKSDPKVLEEAKMSETDTVEKHQN